MNDCFNRLVESGFSPINASEVCKCYETKGDLDGLESFVCSCEKYDPLKAKEEISDGVQ